MNKKKLIKWFEDTSIRAVKTMAEAALGIIMTCSYMGQVDWKMLFSASILSGLACFLMNVKRLPGGDTDEDVEKE